MLAQGLGASPAEIGLLFVSLTMAGTPIVFMLAIVGIVAMFSPSFLGLTFYPFTDPILPFFTSQSVMGLSGGSELLVILAFLVVAEVMNASGMSARLITFAAALVAHLRGGMAYVAQLTSAVVSGTWSAKRIEPYVVRRPAVSNMSLTASGMPVPTRSGRARKMVMPQH